MAFRIVSRLRIPNSIAPKTLTRSFSRSTKPGYDKNGLVGVAGLTALGIFLGHRSKTGHDKSFFNMPTVAAAQAKTVKLEPPAPIPTAMKQKSPSFTPKPMANNTGSSCRRKEKNDQKAEQPNVISPLRGHSLMLWISLKNTANPCATVKAACNLQSLVEELNDPQCPDDDVVAGVGFGPNFYSQVMGKTCKSYYYTNRKGKNGEMPCSCGDIFVHAKCENKGKLFELCQCFLRCLPPDSIEEFEDTYCFTYQDGRDLTGFLMNQTNREDKQTLKEIAVEQGTGGSYALAQKWVHDFCAIEDAGQKKLEAHIGKSMDCNEDNPQKCITSHVARMNGGTEYQDPPPYEVMSQGQSYGCLAGEAGLFYLAFACDPSTFEFYLDRMIGASCDGGHDDIMKITCNVKGTYWYFPGVAELQQLANAN